ncbi:hypothetical protein CMQ_6207 [Grosmannia clavigera kw1407]|uniref:C6 zinc finger domain containing protein n=1 Tax=Grosmannia clavigera (strain kw1407 / UAMH 11150) TaxID=655863 RepID=F0XM44_GROCL|nr:uncharacterized protein CMQ_6207 [Grosmannia clavigera kw1407]EFX01265.1 hypothetical protein CMQ_6207 [Grosmannia clavigera kw1407]
MYFNLFRQHTASELSGFFDDVFWSRTVLIECHQADAIRHAVVALGALYKTLETTTESPPSSPDAAGVTPSNAADRAANHWEVALDQYSSACHAVGTVDPANPRSQRTCLIASVLLACFDSFIGDHQQAIRQIQTGLKQLWLLRDSRNSQTVLQVAPDGSYVSQPAVPEPVEDELLQMFTRLAIQAKSYDMAFHFPKPYVIYLLPSTEAGFSELSSSDTSGSSPSSPAGSSDVDSPVTVHQDPIPVRFSSLRDARLAWDTLCEDMLRFTEKMFQSASGPPNILPSSMRRYGIHFQARLTGWSAAFGPLLNSRTRPDVSSQEKAGIAVLKMFQIMGQILFFMTFVDSEMQFDNFQPHFAEIVSLAFEVYGVPSFGPSHIKASFSADLGIVPPLYVVATKSRDRMLRRQAIQLLRSSARREGMWDSELMARIGTWVMEIEEQGDGEEDKLRSWQNSAGMPLTPVDSPAPSTVTLPHRQRSPGVDFGDAPLGPGGNARWDVRRESSTSSVRSSASATSGSLPPAPPPIPAEKRVLVKSCEFDLRGHVATLKCGTRGLVAGKVDHKTQVTRITW